RLSGLVPQAVQVVSERFALAEPRRAGLHASEERGRVRAAVLSRRLQIRQQALLPCRVEEDGLELRQGRGTVVPGRSTTGFLLLRSLKPIGGEHPDVHPRAGADGVNRSCSKTQE